MMQVIEGFNVNRSVLIVLQLLLIKILYVDDDVLSENNSVRRVQQRDH